jgi:flagellar hook-associated protein 2
MTTIANSSTTLTFSGETPEATAQSFATNATSPQQTLLTNQSTAATAQSTALTSLETALTTFQTSLAALTTPTTGVLAQTATFSDTSFGTATAGSSAAPGSYTFFVQQIATSSQMTYSGLTPVSAADAGTLTINQTGLGNSFSVDLSSADTDGDGLVTPQEMATAINAASGNDGQVTASVVTINGQAQLALTSDTTGADSGITLDASGVTDPTLQSELTDPSNIKQTGTPQDAIIWLGDQNTGTEIEQASNTFTNVGGVSMTFTKAMTTGTAPITLNVATDTSGTAANLQAFVTAYNALKGVLTPMLALPTSGTDTTTPGVFASDSGVNLLSSKLVSLVTQTIGGVSLANFGITNQLDGTLALDTSKLNKALANNPNALATLVGSSTGIGTGTGVLGSIDQYVQTWSDSATGQITTRQASVTATQKLITTAQTTLTDTYNDDYTRYLNQFTTLLNLQTQMNSNSSIFDALFSTGSN